MPRTQLDLQTINLDVLRSLPTYELPPSYRLQADPGNGCYGDAPGYPTYFTRSIYTSHGNGTPYRQGRPSQVILFEGVNYVTGFHGQTDVQRNTLMARLYKPLPEDHERVQQWERSIYAHQHHCYLHPTEVGEYGRGRKMIIFPLPSYKLKSFVDDPRFSEDWRQKAKAEVAAHNREEQMLAEAVCIPENAAAVVYIREVYPEHQPRLDWIETSPSTTGDWWTVEAKRPTRKTCPGPYPNNHHRMIHNDKGRCQYCGYEPKTTAAAEEE